MTDFVYKNFVCVFKYLPTPGYFGLTFSDKYFIIYRFWKNMAICDDLLLVSSDIGRLFVCLSIYKLIYGLGAKV